MERGWLGIGVAGLGWAVGSESRIPDVEGVFLASDLTRLADIVPVQVRHGASALCI